MRRRFRMSVILLWVLVLVLAVAGTAFAAPFSSKAPPEPTTAYKDVGIQSLTYLQDWGCNLISGSGGYITITGFTQAYQNVDYIMVRLYLQRWNGSSWVDLGSWPFEKYNASRVDGAKGLLVATGYYYRVRAIHSLTNSGITEPTTPANSCTSSVYIK